MNILSRIKTAALALFGQERSDIPGKRLLECYEHLLAEVFRFRRVAIDLAAAVEPLMKAAPGTPITGEQVDAVRKAIGAEVYDSAIATMRNQESNHVRKYGNPLNEATQ